MADITKRRLSTRLSTPPPRKASPQKNGFNGLHTNGYSAHTNGYSTNGQRHTNGHANGDSNNYTHTTNGADYHILSNGRNIYDDFYGLVPTPSPPPEPPLRQRLIGAWRLESYIAHPTPESPIQRPTYPMTKNVTGLILYTPDGYMSAQMLIPGQKSFKRGEGEEPQWAEAGKRCFNYAGPYYISNEGEGRQEVLRHTFQVCNLPGWVGDIQVRTWKFEEDGQVLVLGSEEPTEIKGDNRIPELKWRRAVNNSLGSPPPPMPRIKVSGPGEP